MPKPHYVQDNQPTYLDTIEECASESSSGPNFDVDVYVEEAYLATIPLVLPAVAMAGHREG